VTVPSDAAWRLQARDRDLFASLASETLGSVCVYDCSTYYKAVRAGGGG
jgi:hypothetical protein